MPWQAFVTKLPDKYMCVKLLKTYHDAYCPSHIHGFTHKQLTPYLDTVI